MNKNLNIRYDEEGDVLYLRIGEPTESYYEDLGDDVFERRDEKTGKVTGFMILNFKKRAEKKKDQGIQIQADMQIVSS